MKTLSMILGLTFFTASAWAHEGHDHGPKSAQATQGGVLHQGKKVGLEVVQESGELKLYPLDATAKPLKASDVKVSGTYELPKGKPEPLALTAKGDYLSAKVDAKGAHRFGVKLKVDYQGSAEDFSFQVEPQE